MNRYEKKETPVSVFAALLVFLLICGYYISGIFKLPGLTLGNVEEKLYYVIAHPFYNWWNHKTIVIMLLAFFVWIILITYIQYYYRDFHMDIEHGSADWLSPEKACSELKDSELRHNRILTQNVQVSLVQGLSNNNALIIGSSGTYKTTSFVEQNLLQFDSCYVMLDVKGTTMRNLGNAFLQAGYTVRALDFKSPEKSNCYNPFVYIETEDDLLRVVKGLQDALRPQKEMSSADPFWDDGVRLYLQALFYYAWLDTRDTGKAGTLNDVIGLTNAENIKMADGETTRLQYLMDRKEMKYGENYPPVRDYRKLKEGAPDTVRSITIMVNAMFSLFETAEMKRIFEKDEMNIREMGTGVGGNPDKKVVLFLVSPDYNSPYTPMFSIFYTQMFDILMRLSDNELKCPLPVRVEVFLDEFYAGAKPVAPEQLAGVIRSRNICMLPIVQSISQLKTVMKDDKWETLMDNMSAVLFLGSGPLAKSTHEYISELLGKSTIDSRDDSVNRGTNPHSGLSFKKTGRELMTPDEVKRMPQTEAIVFLESKPPIYDVKAIPFDVERHHYIAPVFLKHRYEKALSLGPYDHPVYTVYDPEHFRYITVEREKRLQIVTGEEKDTYLAAAKNNPHIYSYDIDEEQLLYLSWGKPRREQEEIEIMYKEAIKKEEEYIQQLHGLAVLQDVEGDVPNFGTNNVQNKEDKAVWNTSGTLKEILARYWEKLSFPEQEEICFAMDDGLTEEQVCKLVFVPLEKMSQYRRAYRLMNENCKEAQS